MADIFTTHMHMCNNVFVKKCVKKQIRDTTAMQQRCIKATSVILLAMAITITTVIFNMWQCRVCAILLCMHVHNRKYFNSTVVCYFYSCWCCCIYVHKIKYFAIMALFGW